MEILKSAYETLYVIDPSVGEEGVRALITKFNELISANGEIESTNEWGNRRLAYPIRVGSREVTDGYYVLVNYTSSHDFPAELNRIFNITDGILRSLTTKVEK
ncbi:MAG TPA: 30S ribosomal protein S6 [Bacillota bacterium]|nr:30S ribosomal protein S6 [Bacillota bacterium]